MKHTHWEQTFQEIFLLALRPKEFWNGIFLINHREKEKGRINRGNVIHLF